MPKQLPLEQVAVTLQIPSAGQALCTGWDEALQARPFEAPHLFESAYIAWAAQAVGLTDEMIQALVAFAARIAGDEDVAAFFWYCRHRVLCDPTLVLSWEEPWPPLDDYLGPDAGLLNVLVMLSVVPEMLETYRRLGIPADIVRDTVADLRLWMETDRYYLRHRRWGITPWIARWLCKHWQGKLLQLGRLQFSLSRFNLKVRVHRRRSDGCVLALAETGNRYAADGSAWCSLCGDEAHAWTSDLVFTQDAVEGNPILPTGYAQREPVRLPLAEWDEVLAPGDPSLTFHVSAGGPLDFAACGDSCRQALEIFPRVYPDFAFRGFWTATWLLDARLEGLLSPGSNIVRLQHEIYLIPGLQGDNGQIYQRVFGWGVTDINAVPWQTSMQRAVGRYLNGGGHFHGGYGFLLRDDLRWGEQVYRSALGVAAPTHGRGLA